MRPRYLPAFIILSILALDAPAAEVFRQPQPKDKCPVCGMFIARYTSWIVEIVFRDGSYAAFDGPKDMFKFHADLVKFAPRRKQSDIAAIFATDYYAVKPIDGFKAFYVLGSDVHGPMGRELVSFENQADAREFMKDHQGGRILRFNEITSDVLRGLD